MRRASLGAWGEAQARAYLLRQGYTLHAGNWRSPEGEIDIIAEIGGTLVFVEVKTRRTAAFGAPEEAVSPRKVRHLIRASAAYLESHTAGDRAWRIDVIAITAGPGPRIVRLEHFADAIEAPLP